MTRRERARLRAFRLRQLLRLQRKRVRAVIARPSRRGPLEHTPDMDVEMLSRYILIVDISSPRQSAICGRK